MIKIIGCIFVCALFIVTTFSNAANITIVNNYSQTCGEVCDLEVTVITTKDVYCVGELVPIMAGAKNIGDEEFTLEFRTSQRGDFKITNEENEGVYRWYLHQRFAPQVTPVTFPPGKTVILAIEYWEQVNDDKVPVPVGTYRIEGWMVEYYWNGISQDPIYAEPINIVIDDEIPYVDAGGPYHWRIGDTKILDGSNSYDQDGTIVNWYWFYYRVCNDVITNPEPIAEGPNLETIGFPEDEPGFYEVNLEVTDNDGLSNGDCALVYIYENPPNTPSKPSGPTTGKSGYTYPYFTSASHPDFCSGDAYIQYGWDWGDGSEIEWTDWWYPTEEPVTINHFWSEKGTYQIRVKARDRFAESEWSDPLSVSMPKNKQLIELESGIYVDNFKEISFPIPIIVGSIDIEVDAEGATRVEFYIDGELEATVTEKPHIWKWDEFSFGRHTLKVVAYDNAGNSDTDEMTVWKFF